MYVSIFYDNLFLASALACFYSLFIDSNFGMLLYCPLLYEVILNSPSLRHISRRYSNIPLLILTGIALLSSLNPKCSNPIHHMKCD